MGNASSSRPRPCAIPKEVETRGEADAVTRGSGVERPRPAAKRPFKFWEHHCFLA